MDHTQAISTYVTDFISQFDFPDSITADVAFDETGNRYDISLHTADPSLIIGYHGETLASLQFVLAQHLNSLLGEWTNLSLNVNDYNQRRQHVLYDLADTTVNQVLSTHRPYALPPLTASERRLIHLYLQNHPQVTTSSEGIGRSRTLIISPKV